MVYAVVPSRFGMSRLAAVDSDAIDAFPVAR
jgi:hypothetical protein